MPTYPETVRFNLEYYRKQAKALLRAAKAGDSDALWRLGRVSSRLNEREAVNPASALALHDVQLVIAREQGFSSWPRFKSFIVKSQLNFQELVDAFIDAAVSDGRRAEALLAAHPGIAGAGFYVALVLGDWKQVERVVAEMPEMAKAKSGPQKCEPLLYVCFSRYANGQASRASDLVETARVLLRYGADANAAFTPEDLPDNPLSCLYAATGLNNNPALALALLEAGANPNDGESLYHSTEHPDLACTELLLRRGATPAGANALKHMLDREDLRGLRLLLGAGANPNETNDRGETALHWAVWRGRSPEAIAMLLDHGAELNFRRKDGRTAYALAVLGGQADVAALLKAHGADTALAKLDEFVAAAFEEGDRPVTFSGGLASSENGRLLPDLASTHRTASVRALLAAGMAVDSRGEAGGTALHWACWKGYADLVKLLIEHRASFTIEDSEYHAPPSGWLHHGSQNCREEGGDYAQCARLLIAAGAPMRECDTATGNVELDTVLRKHNLIR